MSTNSSPGPERVGPETAINDDDIEHESLTPSGTVPAGPPPPQDQDGPGEGREA